MLRKEKLEEGRLYPATGEASTMLVGVAEKIVGEMAESSGEVLPYNAGVVRPDPVTGGRDSSNEAPNEDVGLKGFKPVNPVMCELTGEIGGVERATNGVVDDKCEWPAMLVAWDDKDIDSGPVVEVAFILGAVEGFVDSLPFAKVKEEATLEISDAPGLSELWAKLKGLELDVWGDCWSCGDFCSREPARGGF